MVWCQADDKPLLESTARWLIPCGDTRPQWVALMNSSCHVPSHVSLSNMHGCCWWVDAGLAQGHLQPSGWPMIMTRYELGSILDCTEKEVSSFWLHFRTWLPMTKMSVSGNGLYQTTANNDLDFSSLSDKTSYRKISWRLEAVRFEFRLFQ